MLAFANIVTGVQIIFTFKSELIEKAYKLKDFTVTVGGSAYTFPEVSVATETGGPANDRLANLGMDYFRQFDKVILNTKDMFVRMRRK